MSPLGRMVFPRAPPSGKPSTLGETFRHVTHTGMAYLYNIITWCIFFNKDLFIYVHQRRSSLSFKQQCVNGSKCSNHVNSDQSKSIGQAHPSMFGHPEENVIIIDIIILMTKKVNYKNIMKGRISHLNEVKYQISCKCS